MRNVGELRGEKIVQIWEKGMPSRIVKAREIFEKDRGEV